MEQSSNYSGVYLPVQEETNPSQAPNLSTEPPHNQQHRTDYQPKYNQSLSQNINHQDKVSQQTKLSPTTPRRLLGVIRKRPTGIIQQSEILPTGTEQQLMKKWQEKSFHQTQSARGEQNIEQKPFTHRHPSSDNPQKSIFEDNTSQRHSSAIHNPSMFTHHIGQGITQQQQQYNHHINNYRQPPTILFPTSRTDLSYSQSPSTSSNKEFNNTTEFKEMALQEKGAREVVVSDQNRHTASGCVMKSLVQSQSQPQQSAKQCQSVAYSHQVENQPTNLNRTKKQSLQVNFPSRTRSMKDPQNKLQQQLLKKQLLQRMNKKVQSQSQSKEIEKINMTNDGLRNERSLENDDNKQIKERLQLLQKENQRNQKKLNDMKSIIKNLLKSPNSEVPQTHRSVMSAKISPTINYKKPRSQFNNQFKQDDISSQSSVSQYGGSSQSQKSIVVSACGGSPARNSQIEVSQRDKSIILPRLLSQTITTDLDQSEQLSSTQKKNFKKKKTSSTNTQPSTVIDLQQTVLVTGKKKAEKIGDKQDNGKFECMEIIRGFFN